MDGYDYTIIPPNEMFGSGKTMHACSQSHVVIYKTGSYLNQTFTSGSINGATRCANISILDDNALEVNENFTLTLSTEDSNIKIGTSVTTITIIDNDS